VAEAEPQLEARNLVKRYGQVLALSGANFTAFPGEVTALIGDNGAGKSTLVKCLSGAIRPDGGQIFVEGQPVTLASPLDARRHGIETVYQDLALAAELDPAANLYLGREVMRGGVLGKLGFLDKSEMRRRSDRQFKDLGVAIQDTGAPVATMSGGQRQGVAVSRAVTWASKVVFMDEPTAALGVVQTRNVLDLIRRVRDRGLSVVLISHNMPEVLEVADRIEVLRLGERVARFERGDVTMEQIVGAMTGAIRHEEEAA
jgi:simple sugar transport system ATP-binding protein